MMNEITEILRTSLKIEDLISETVKLRPSSRGYIGLCPFHQEDTPSFHVYTDTQSYYCFGCQKGGNIFTFVMEKEHVNFREALQILSDRAGIKLPENRGERTHDIMKLSEDFFTSQIMAKNVALAYLRKRALTDSDIKTFGLGYAPESWDALTLHLRKNGLNDKQIIASGLCVQSRNGIYDRFRGRIIFPIHDITGRTIAFGGRIITGDGAKYINSPESEIYRKRKNLYFLDRAKNAIRDKKRSILCEGYMDAIRLQKSGFHESVASLGTSLTAEQAELLSRYADRCYICYDSDMAGQNASIRGMYILQAHGLDVRVMRLPDGKDPDEFLLSHEPSDFEALIAQAKPLIPAHIEILSSRLNDTSTRKSALKELFSSLEALRASEVLEYKSELCEASHMLPGELERMIIPKSENIPEFHAPKPKTEPERNTDEPECALCSLMMKNERFRLMISPEQIMNIITNPDVRELALAILNEDVNMLSIIWTETGDTEKLGILERGDILCHQMLGMNDDEKFMRIYSALKRSETERRIAAINALPMKERDMKELYRLYCEREKYAK